MDEFVLDDSDRQLITYLFGKIGPQPTKVGRKLLILVRRGVSDMGVECMQIEVAYKPEKAA